MWRVLLLVLFFISVAVRAAGEPLNGDDDANALKGQMDAAVGPIPRANAESLCTDYSDVMSLLTPANVGMLDVDTDLAKIVSNTGNAKISLDIANPSLDVERTNMTSAKEWQAPMMVQQSSIADSNYSNAQTLLGEARELATIAMPPQLVIAWTGYSSARTKANGHSSSTELTNCKLALDGLVSAVYSAYPLGLSGLANILDGEIGAVDTDRQNNLVFLEWGRMITAHPDQNQLEDSVLPVTGSSFSSNPKGVGYNGAGSSSPITP